MTSRQRTSLGLLIAVFFLPACASVPPEQKVESDPWEGLNRTVFEANLIIDKVTTKPLAKGYQAITPGPVRTGVSNFFRNLTAPRSMVNNFLQGKPGRGFSEFGRFLFNSTLGIGGIFDVATAGGIQAYPEDFGQTAAVWGVPDGPYVMLPFLGPQTLRDALLTPIDLQTNPIYFYDNTSVKDKVNVLRIIDLRYRLLPTDRFLEDSKDKYITTRESFLQNRTFEIYDGDPPIEDDFFDEFLEEE